MTSSLPDVKRLTGPLVALAVVGSITACGSGSAPSAQSSAGGVVADQRNRDACELYNSAISDVTAVLSGLYSGEMPTNADARLLAGASAIEAAADMATGSVSIAIKGAANAVASLGSSLDTSNVEASQAKIQAVSEEGTQAQSVCNQVLSASQ